MKSPDPHKEQSERKVSLDDFLKFYNESLPTEFPRASVVFLEEFSRMHPKLFSGNNSWSLDQHRKKFMDWLPQHIKHRTS